MAQSGVASEHLLVRPGSTLTIRFPDRTEEVYRIDARFGEGTMLSAKSPLGHAILGRRAGDAVGYRAPSGLISVLIVEVW